MNLGEEEHPPAGSRLNSTADRWTRRDTFRWRPARLAYGRLYCGELCKKRAAKRRYRSVSGDPGESTDAPAGRRTG